MPYTFGIEIECIVPGGTSASQVAEKISQHFPCAYAGYTHQGTSSWKIVSDASVNAAGVRGGSGIEVVSPVLGIDRIDEIDKVCAVLSQVRCGVNRSCGLHVHVGARSLSVDAMKALALLYADAEEIIDSLLPPSRRQSNNSYCTSVKGLDRSRVLRASSATDIATAIRSDSEQRRVKLNYVSYWRHGTVEFRHHSGTVDPAKIKSWVRFCLKMVEAAERDAASIPVPQRSYQGGNIPTRGSYWARGRRTRMIFTMLTRSQGATAEEIREVLGVRSRPDIGWHLERAGLRGNATRMGRRNRMQVFKLRSDDTSTPVQTPAAPPVGPITTLEELLDKLQVDPSERTFWVERQSMLAGETT